MSAESRASSPCGDTPLPEGHEHAPPGTRAMSIVRWSLVGLMAVAAAAAWISYVGTGGVHSRAEQRFHCPMHPSIVAAQRGACPICGMDLVPIGAAVSAHPPAASVARAAPPAHAAATGPQYTCPMHPELVTADPAARCPECGMKLVPREPVVAAAGPGVPGLAEVELTIDRIQLSGMRTAVARREPLASSLRTVGFVSATESGVVSVNTRFSGWVDALRVGETGVLVDRGTILATVYSPEMLNAQQVFLNAVKWSERRAAPQPAAGAPGAEAPAGSVVSDLERDARQRLELLGVAQEDIELIARTGQVLRSMNVRSPVRGHVARKGVLRGVYVQPGTELFQIVDLSNVWLLADVYEAEIGRVRLGQRATLSVAAWPGERFEGKVTFLSPAVSTGARTLQARIELRNPGLRLRPGMYGDVVLDTGASEAVTVPREALVDTGDVQYVFVARGQGRFAPRRVRAGPAVDGKIAILEGLADGERVVTTANFLVDSESRLRAAVEAGGPGSPTAGADDAQH